MDNKSSKTNMEIPMRGEKKVSVPVNGETRKIKVDEKDRLELENLVLKRESLQLQIALIEAQIQAKIRELEGKYGGQIVDGTLDLKTGECEIKEK